MNLHNFERIRDDRRAALAVAASQPDPGFCPYGNIDIRAIEFIPASRGRGTLYIEDGTGGQRELAGFPTHHAEQLCALEPARQLAFLRDVWINYLAWRCAH